MNNTQISANLGDSSLHIVLLRALLRFGMEIVVSSIVWHHWSSAADVTCDKCDVQTFLIQHKSIQ